MNPQITIMLLGLPGLIIAAFIDFKRKLIPNWLTYAMIIFLATFRLTYSMISHDWIFFFQGVIGFLVFSIIGMIVFQQEIMGGGDVKLLMAMGLLIFIHPNWIQNLGASLMFSSTFAALIVLQSSVLKIFRKSNHRMPMGAIFLVAFAIFLLFQILI